MLELDGFFGFALLAFWLYCLYDVITTEESVIRNLPKMVWLILVLLLPDIGGLAWLLLGRPQKWQLAQPRYRGESREPFDAGDLDGMIPIVREREERARMKMWEAQLKRREEEIRRRELGLGSTPPSEDPPAIDP
jgi:hypothetical protein